jgi:hypothetical protein
MDKDKLNVIWLTDSIISFVEKSSKNILGGNYSEKAWESPLVGFSRGDDELYSFLKEDIGDFYYTPLEIFSMTYPNITVKSEDISVISWILPQTKSTKVEQRKDKTFPTEKAVLARVNGDKFNRSIGEYVVGLLDQEGYKSLSPMLSPFWENKESEKYGYASNWSERHSAFISGLGTFGLSDGLITSVGKAMRCGSVIAKIDVEPTERNYKTHNEYCLFYKNGSCMKCAERCPAKAISDKGHDKQKCREYQRNVTSLYINQAYNIDSRYCGICQFGIPCESKIPKV